MISTITINVSFTKHTLIKKDLGVVQGDYNTTKFVFVFEDDVTGHDLLFKMSDPFGRLIVMEYLTNNQLILTGHDVNGNPASLFAESGLYPFEISAYDGNGLITSAPGWLNVHSAQVPINDASFAPNLTYLDDLVDSKIDDELTGDSAYEIAVKNGFKGTEQEWLASLAVTLTPEDKTDIAGMMLEELGDIHGYETMTEGEYQAAAESNTLITDKLYVVKEDALFPIGSMGVVAVDVTADNYNNVMPIGTKIDSVYLGQPYSGVNSCYLDLDYALRDYFSVTRLPGTWVCRGYIRYESNGVPLVDGKGQPLLADGGWHYHLIQRVE